MRGFLADPSEELIKLIRAEADEPHHSDLEAALPLCVCNYTCIISAVNSGHHHFLLLFLLPLLLLLLPLCHHTATIHFTVPFWRASNAQCSETLPRTKSSQHDNYIAPQRRSTASTSPLLDWETRVCLALEHMQTISLSKLGMVICQARDFFSSPIG